MNSANELTALNLHQEIKDRAQSPQPFEKGVKSTESNSVTMELSTQEKKESLISNGNVKPLKSDENKKSFKPFKPVRVNLEKSLLESYKMTTEFSKTNGGESLLDVMTKIYPIDVEVLNGKVSLLDVILTEVPFKDHIIKHLEKKREKNKFATKADEDYYNTITRKYFGLCLRINKIQAKLIFLNVVHTRKPVTYDTISQRFEKLDYYMKEKRLIVNFTEGASPLYTLNSLLDTTRNCLIFVGTEIKALVPAYLAAYNVTTPYLSYDPNIHHSLTQHAFIGSLDKEPDYYYIIRLLLQSPNLSIFDNLPDHKKGEPSRSDQWLQYHTEMSNLFKFLSLNKAKVSIEPMLYYLKNSYTINQPLTDFFNYDKKLSKTTFSALLYSCESFILHLYLFIATNIHLLFPINPPINTSSTVNPSTPSPTGVNATTFNNTREPPSKKKRK